MTPLFDSESENLHKIEQLAICINLEHYQNHNHELKELSLLQDSVSESLHKLWIDRALKQKQRTIGEENTKYIIGHHGHSYLLS